MLNHFHPDLRLIGKLESSFLVRLIISGMGVLFLTWFSALIQFSKPPSFSQELYYWAGLTLTTPILYYAGLPLLRSWLTLKSFRFSIDIPLITTLIASYFYSLYATLLYSENNYAYFESILLVLFIVYAGRYLETFCRKRIARMALNLIKLPSREVKIIKKEDEQIHTADLDDIKIGDKLYITPEEYFPVDGIICDSETSVDESMLTGEAHAIPKFNNDKVRAGTCNLDKAVTIQATSIFSNSYFGKILSSLKLKHPNKYVENSPCDHIALWHLMITLTLAAAIYCWWLPFDNKIALFCTNSTLLITCPCAIAIAYPLVVACVLEVSAKRGILIKNPEAFFKLEEVEYVLFDKTGTLTEGNLIVDHVEYLNHASAQSVLPLIALIEKSTHHPIAYAIVQFTEQQFELPSFEIHRLRVFPGNGVRALVDSKFILIGSARWLRKNGIFVPTEVIEAQESHLHADRIFVHCAIGGVEVARIQLKDKLRSDAASVIHFLKKRNIEMSVLSGDRPAIVDAIAKQLGPITATAQALPQEKEAQVTFLQDQGYITAMVGDGLNDAPALQRADIGIAMGTRNPISNHCADIILQNPSLKLIQECFLMSGFARKILKQNYLLALAFHSLMLPFAAVGRINATVVLVGVALSTLLVMANTARLKFARFPIPEQTHA